MHPAADRYRILHIDRDARHAFDGITVERIEQPAHVGSDFIANAWFPPAEFLVPLLKRHTIPILLTVLIRRFDPQRRDRENPASRTEELPMRVDKCRARVRVDQFVQSDQACVSNCGCNQAFQHFGIHGNDSMSRYRDCASLPVSRRYSRRRSLCVCRRSG